MTVNIFDMADEWNDGATTFTAIRMDVDDQASAADSMLLNLLVGGNSRHLVDKLGNLRLGSWIGGATIRSSENNNHGFDISSSLGAVVRSPLSVLSVTNARVFFNLSSTARFELSTSGAVHLSTDAADILAQRRGVNPQASRIYNTFTDTSNYERGGLRWASNVLQLFTEADGTGTPRNIVLNGANRAAYSETAADLAAALVSHGIMSPP